MCVCIRSKTGIVLGGVDVTPCARQLGFPIGSASALSGRSFRDVNPLADVAENSHRLAYPASAHN